MSLLSQSCVITWQVSSLWHEYEAAQTPEALLVKDFDKLEMIIQVRESLTNKRGWHKDLICSFWSSQHSQHHFQL